ncbi:MAG: Na+/H+ antiporter NhaA [Actinobacteria bacterium]|nr:Na+/H+ antiporter NhaA [Actinomycetota bacterium]
MSVTHPVVDDDARADSPDRHEAPPATDAGLPPAWAESQRFVPRRFVQPAMSFFRTEAAGGITMLIAALTAIVWSNSSFGDSYFRLFGAHVDITFGNFAFHHLSELTVREWINDALMAVFFFVVGLEIKRELVIGGLRDRRAAMLPAVAAIGGMVLPALLYVAFTRGTDTVGGWGIPMATDIAFAAGAASMLGRRLPIGAKLFLLALAIVDDLGAILVIALFYTSELSLGWLAAAGGGLVAIHVMNRVHVRHLAPYLALGGFIWLAVLESGVHATIAGVALALLTPVASFYAPTDLPHHGRHLLARIADHLPVGTSPDVDHHARARAQALIAELQRLARESTAPLDRLEHALVRWSSFVIIPVFALANAGVRIDGGSLGNAVGDPTTVGIAVGLVVGKTVGITAAAWVAVRIGLARLPDRTTWGHMIGVALLAGIGFTVALFVSALSFPSDAAAADSAKIGIFAGSIVAGLGGYLWLRGVGAASREPAGVTPSGAAVGIVTPE